MNFLSVIKSKTEPNPKPKPNPKPYPDGILKFDIL